MTLFPERQCGGWQIFCSEQDDMIPPTAQMLTHRDSECWSPHWIGNLCNKGIQSQVETLLYLEVNIGSRVMTTPSVKQTVTVCSGACRATRVSTQLLCTRLAGYASNRVVTSIL